MHAFIVTGASRGLGLALTEALLADGYRVAGLARGAVDALAALARRYPERLSAIDVDLSDAAAVAPAIAAAVEQLKPADCASLNLINNAGVVSPIAQAGHYPAEDVVRALAINLAAPMLATDALLRASAGLKARRRILNISSGAAAKPYPGWSVYCTTKAGLDHFSRSVAAEQAGQANAAQIVALYPGVVDTDMQASIRGSDAEQFPQKARFDALKADGELSTPAAAARRIVDHLLSPAFGLQAVVDIRNLG
ncbi:NAD(P)-dependent dehydrogenase (short-subunit alcohol dehydrogenase family) [Chromobacterium alkanivorans]|uniref:SDR family oxidoreductase n=1 Tax=Chromobacterium alkanivorans TaxID=1071719 RepID=UPI002167609D|nr:SDR family oxidoreductase [Chromobacterium alkanivorans]MCS3805865.1 NAD(P)-dependent dehydrogenase (short-subunit alcohol dehydrogenase family) [Chromobacterium alkanivorans]MCS3820203.1 NAD(P)-dependent dehydrogenase (short-subunit alcohol dehydrogenase family) [Chromobacterium alkanivorans]MCS3874961.1 NAD(P)-dependent dehydrogenase (short-subunit alcohol dehydrogenase family) [Chromobacterium alkanivorans]